MEEVDSFGIVYVLTNPAMPGLVKIGKTSRNTVEIRLQELYSTGVPVPFECAYAAMIKDESAVEKAFHQAFGPYRINAKREFFQIEPDQAIALLRLMAEKDVTPEIQQEADEVDVETKSASTKLKARRPNLNFVEMGIPIGSTINFIDTNESATIVTERKVEYEGEHISLTALTRKLLSNEHDVAPAPYWYFQGKVLRELYNETYSM